MSRNERYKTKPHVGQKGAKKKAPSKSPAKTNKNTSSWSDDDYADVDLVSSEDESDIRKAEDSAIVGSDLFRESDRDSEDPSYEDDQSFNVFLPDDDTQFFQEQFQCMGSEPEVADLNVNAAEHVFIPRQRGGQFPTRSSSSGSSDTEDNSFDPQLPNADDPTNFWDVDSMAPDLRRAIWGNDDGVASSEASSYWDLEAERGQQQIVGNEDNSDGDDSDGSSDGTSSGYETDVGETTDEDSEIGPRCIPPGRSVLRPISADAEEEIPANRRKSKCKPRIGIFVEEVGKPNATVDQDGVHLLIWKNRGQNPSTVLNDMSLDMSLTLPLTDSANVMVGATLNKSNLIFGNYGPPEAFFASGGLLPDSSSYDEDDENDGDSGDVLEEMENFINFDEDSSGQETGNKSGDEAEPPSSTPARAAGAKEGPSHTSHLNNKIVGSFRNNQNQHFLISRNAATPEGLAFGGNGPIRGIKSGRLPAANTPITPMRKQKLPKTVAAASSPGSPLARAESQKRKASGQESGKSHKRNRSIF